MRLLALFLVASSLLLFATSCETTTEQKVYSNNISSREQVFDKAQSMYPQPIPQDFPARKDLVDYTNRLSLPNHPFYVYILGDNGNAVGYFVARTAPQNSCNFLSSTEKVDTLGMEDGAVVVQAPSLDGIYYGGTGASGACNEFFFFDNATNALVKIGNMKYFTADRPIALNVEPISIKASE